MSIIYFLELTTHNLMSSKPDSSYCQKEDGWLDLKKKFCKLAEPSSTNMKKNYLLQ